MMNQQSLMSLYKVGIRLEIPPVVVLGITVMLTKP